MARDVNSNSSPLLIFCDVFLSTQQPLDKSEIPNQCNTNTESGARFKALAELSLAALSSSSTSTSSTSTSSTPATTPTIISLLSHPFYPNSFKIRSFNSFNLQFRIPFKNI